MAKWWKTNENELFLSFISFPKYTHAHLWNDDDGEGDDIE